MTDKKSDRTLTYAERIFVRISVLQTVLALAGIFTGAVALYAALNEADAVRKQQEASVWPRVEFERSFHGGMGKDEIQLVVRNVGIGPAEIRSARATLDGAPVTSSRDIVQALTENKMYFGLNSALAPDVLRPGDDAHFFQAEESLNRENGITAPIAEPLRAAYDSGRLVFEICYCSVFERCWMKASNKARPTPTAACPDHGDDAYTF